MPARLFYAWRVAGYALALAAIGLGGSAMAVLIFPPIALLTRDAALRRHRIQWVIRQSFRLYLFAITRLQVIGITVTGAEKLRGLSGKLIVANHPSLLDVVLIMAMAPRVQCVVKAELWRHPFFRLTVQGAGYIRNDLPPEEFVATCAEVLWRGDNIIIFPEGTRSVPGRPLDIKRGFANLATIAEADLQLITITCDPPTLVKGVPWYRIPPVKSDVRVEVGECLDIAQFLRYRYRPVAARKLVEFVKSYYSRKLGLEYTAETPLNTREHVR